MIYCLSRPVRGNLWRSGQTALERGLPYKHALTALTRSVLSGQTFGIALRSQGFLPVLHLHHASRNHCQPFPFGTFSVSSVCGGDGSNE
jgi:hypothetical protein